MSYEQLTDKQKEILEFIKQEILHRGYPPSVRDICEAVHLRSTSSVHAHLSTLEKMGFIRRDPSKSRTIEVVDEQFNLSRRELSSIPVLGHIAAGEPLLAEEHIESYFPIPVEYLPNRECFMLNVHGDSMVNKGIFDGDMILCEERNTARNGDVVVALLDDSATVKTFYKEKDHIRLQPENDYMDPIIVRENVSVLGKVIGVFRFL